MIIIILRYDNTILSVLCASISKSHRQTASKRAVVNFGVIVFEQDDNEPKTLNVVEFLYIFIFHDVMIFYFTFIILYYIILTSEQISSNILLYTFYRLSDVRVINIYIYNNVHALYSRAVVKAFIIIYCIKITFVLLLR